MVWDKDYGEEELENTNSRVTSFVSYTHHSFLELLEERDPGYPWEPRCDLTIL